MSRVQFTHSAGPCTYSVERVPGRAVGDPCFNLRLVRGTRVYLTAVNYSDVCDHVLFRLSPNDYSAAVGIEPDDIEFVSAGGAFLEWRVPYVRRRITYAVWLKRVDDGEAEAPVTAPVIHTVDTNAASEQN